MFVYGLDEDSLRRCASRAEALPILQKKFFHGVAPLHVCNVFEMVYFHEIASFAAVIWLYMYIGEMEKCIRRI
jgi:hypothetical protein